MSQDPERRASIDENGKEGEGRNEQRQFSAWKDGLGPQTLGPVRRLAKCADVTAATRPTSSACDVILAAEAAAAAPPPYHEGLGADPSPPPSVAYQVRLRVRCHPRVRGYLPRARAHVRSRRGGAARAVDGVPGACSDPTSPPSTSGTGLDAVEEILRHRDRGAFDDEGQRLTRARASRLVLPGLARLDVGSSSCAWTTMIR